MTEAEQEPGNALVLAHTGEVVDLSDERQIATAYSEVHSLQARLAEASRRLREAMGERSKVLGSKTFYIEGIGKIEVKSTSDTEWDALALEEGLRELGCPEEIIREIVVETVVYKVDGRRAQQAAAANNEYKEVIDRCRRTIERIPSVQITGGGKS